MKKEGDHKEINIPVSGMKCTSCSKALETELSKLDGVISSSVDFATKRTSIIYDPEKVHVSSFNQTIEKLGFKPLTTSSKFKFWGK